ncbi:MAG: type I DNA topoisomerase [Deferribacteraceae bacterium]|nr:type I DNA topoisomerase [Deferribacteraceae bacterium]
MAKNLIIVESPAKARTIEHYLGSGYEVLASVGHIIDLPKKTLGVDIHNNFAPTYETMPDKEKVVAQLKRAAKAADHIYLAADPDREGEAIAWHVQEAIKEVTKTKPVERVQFNEITKQGIKDGIAHPGAVNMNRVNAQQSRRILDRLVGYQVSPLLWKPLKYGLSAGRVQSVALRLICERENDIEKFVPEESWTLDADFNVSDKGKAKGQLRAALDKHKGVKLELKKEAEADAIIKALQDKPFAITSVEKKTVKNSAPVPFITARLQQEAIRKLGMTAKRAMAVAQQLYEGVDLGAEGRQGLITYMRTDSTRISPEAEKAAAGYITATYGSEYLGAKKAAKNTGKANVQDAHEAVRPTDATRTPQSIQTKLSPEQYKMYKLIWERFIASQMADAQYEQTTILINNGDYEFRATGRVLTFAGYTSVYTEAADEDAKAEDNPALLGVSKANELALKDYEKKQHFTAAPPRFTEASIVRVLEKEGIGRPSTYASIISVVVERTYVEIKDKRMHPTELGRTVNKLLIQNFPKIFDVKFTADMEEGLDKVESGDTKWLDLMNDFYSSFSKELDKAGKKLNVDLQVEGQVCPKCGKPLTFKYGKMGQFIACTGYPECDFTSDFARDEAGKIQLVERKGPEPTGIVCDKCGCEMVIKKSRYGDMLACSGYPECKNIKNYIKLADGSVKVFDAGEKLGQKCPDCDGDVVLKSGKNGLFAACSNYPKCKYTANVEADAEGKLKVVKQAAAQTMGVCDKCGKPMVVKKSWRGPFVACSGYPDCKNAMSMAKALKAMEGGGAEPSDAPSTAPKKVAAKATTVKKTAAKTATAKKAPAATKKTAAAKTTTTKTIKASATKKATTKKSPPKKK